MRLSAYGALALDHIERRVLYAERVDWPSTRASIADAAAHAATPMELHPAIRTVLRRAGGRHSGLLPPGGASRAGPIAWPSALMLHGHGVLVLPSCPGGLRSVRAYAAAGGRALRQHQSADGWVVVRGNSGGSMWPMLAVALPLLGGDGVIGAFVTRDGACTPWWARAVGSALGAGPVPGGADR